LQRIRFVLEGATRLAKKQVGAIFGEPSFRRIADCSIS
jgi:hypothetical protein